MGANAQTSVPAFTAGQVLTAAQMTQINTGTPVFATSTERDAAFGGTGEKALAEGQMAYLEDSNALQLYDGSAWVAVTVGAWTSYTPTISNFTANSLDCAYAQVNDIVFLQIRADVATVSNLPVFSTPSGLDFANTAQFAQQSAHFIDVGTTSYQALVRWNGTTSFYFTSVTTSGSYAYTGGVSATLPFTWASGDIIEGNLWYRTA